MNKIDRRAFLKLSGSTLIGVTLGGIALRVNAQEKITLDDPTAVALKYVHQSAVDGEYCKNCAYIQGEEQAQWPPCSLFAGKLVAAEGWCSAWIKKG
jgi:hypothetical protein